MGTDHYSLPKNLYGEMPWVTVDSSNIKKMYYVERSQQLYIEFLKKTPVAGQDEQLVYVYFDVAPKEYMALKNAESVGKHFWATIRDKKKFLRVVFTDPDKLPAARPKKVKVTR